VHCLNKVLHLDPQNSAARHDLELLGVPTPDQQTPAFKEELEEHWEASETAAPKPDEGDKQKEDPWPISWILGSLGVGVVLIVLGYYAAANGLLDSVLDGNANATATRPGVEDVVPGGRTPTPELTATEALVAPRDPQELLSATYTPTPRYVATAHPGRVAFQEGVRAFESGEWEEAIAAFEEHLGEQAQSPDAAYYIGESYLHLGEYQLAFDAFNHAITIDDQFAPGYLGRAMAALELGDTDSTPISDLNASILLDPNLLRAYTTRAEYYLDQGEPGRALEDMITAETLTPDSALVHAIKARAFLSQENYGQALVSAQRAYQLDLTDLDNYLVLAETLQALDQASDSIEILQTYVNFRAGDGRGWELLGLAYQFSGNEQAALDAFEKALLLDTNLAEAAYYRGLAYLEEDNNSNALNAFRIAVTNAPGWFEARVALARAYLLGGNPTAALLEVNASGNLIENDGQRAAFHYWRAVILETQSLSDLALADWQRLLALPEGAVPADWRQEAEARLNAQ
jgi:tetratricopeptide (TPR) repeat protein